MKDSPSVNALKTHCNQGHIFSFENISLNKRGHRVCKECHKLAERKRRGKTEDVIAHKDKTHCKNGHEYTLDNTGRDKSGHRYCKICNKERGRQRIKFRGHEYKTNTCIYGHLVEDSNISIRSDGYKCCKLCVNRRSREHNDLKFNLDNNYSAQDEDITRQLFNHSCFICGSKNSLQIDHHNPLSSGFGLSITNAVLLCKSCNCTKSDKSPNEFYSVLKLTELDVLFVKAAKLHEYAVI
jgi:hypothetical protein